MSNMLPLYLDGTTLGRRHRQLNEKIEEVGLTSFNFDEIKKLPEETDVDRLFKIDLASKIKDINFIVEILKCGDEFYVSHALKCLWLYDEQFTDVINCDFLHNNVFPFMSEAMVKKTLTAISIHLKNENKICGFYKYCLSNNRKELAKKFLTRISTDTKLVIINKGDKILDSNDKNYKYYQKVIGNSFPLAEAYLTNYTLSSDKMELYHLRYLYSISNEQYLSLLERYASDYEGGDTDWKFGLRMSKDIVLKYKDRILRHPSLYVKLLNVKTMLKYLNGNDIKAIIPSLLPAKNDEFWSRKAYDRVKEFLSAFPVEERFNVLKNIYHNNYPLSEFEMHNEFYFQKYYMLMTEGQRETWALRQLQSNNKIFENNCEYNWYQFINFTNSFVEVKKLIDKTMGSHERIEMLKVIIKSAKTPQDIFTLLTYLCERHINEYNRLHFIYEIMETHNVLEFNDACWDLFNKLLHSIEIYKSICREWGYDLLPKLRLAALFYYILHDKPLPEGIFEILLSGYEGILKDNSRFCSVLERVPKTKQEMIFENLSRSLTDLLQKYDLEKFDVFQVQQIIQSFISLNDIFKRVGYPDVLIEFTKRNEELHSLIFVEPSFDKPLTERQLLPLLNRDVSLFKTKISFAIDESGYHGYRSRKRTCYPNWFIPRYEKITRLLRKLKVYFSLDVAKLWLKESMESLNKSHHMAIFSIFHLADYKQKEEVMLKYAPESPKIDYDKIDLKFLFVQETICRYSMYSRPPLPLNLIQLYLKGDYVRYCLPMFQFYAAHLPYSECTEFIKSLLNAPASIQKHGIRLVFRNCLFDKFKEPIMKLWNNSRDVSLRSVLFLAVYHDVIKYNKDNTSTQRDKFDFLKSMVEDLNEDDDESIFMAACHRNDVPPSLCGEFFECVFIMLQKMPEKEVFQMYRKYNLSCIADKMEYIREGFIDDLIQRFINDIHSAKETLDFDENSYFIAKLNFIAKYLVVSKSDVSVVKKMAVIEKIVNHCLTTWDRVERGVYVTRKSLTEFVKVFSSCMLSYHYPKSIPLFELLLKGISSNLPLEDIYSIIWKLKITILTATVISSVEEQNITDKTAKHVALATTFGKVLSSLLDQVIEEKLYFAAMVPEIVNSIEECLRYLSSFGPWSKLDYTTVLLTSTFLNIDSSPSCLIVIYLLPLEISDEHKEEYWKVLKKLMSSNDLEVKCMFYKKFNGDFKRLKLC